MAFPEGDVVPSAWVQTGDVSWVVATDYAHSAPSSLKATVEAEAPGGAALEIPVNNPSEIAFWHRGSGSAQLGIAYLDGGGSYVFFSSGLFDGSETWQLVQVAVTFPTTKLKISLTSTPFDNGTAWIDDVQITEGSGVVNVTAEAVGLGGQSKFGTASASMTIIPGQWPGVGLPSGWSQSGSVSWEYSEFIGYENPGSLRANNIRNYASAIITSPPKLYEYGGSVKFAISGDTKPPAELRVVAKEQLGTNVTLLTTTPIFPTNAPDYIWEAYTFEVPPGTWRFEFSAIGLELPSYEPSVFYLDDFLEKNIPEAIGFSSTQFGLPRLKSVVQVQGFVSGRVSSPEVFLRNTPIPLPANLWQSGVATSVPSWSFGKPYAFVAPTVIRNTTCRHRKWRRSSVFGTPTI